jgi:23S rRNA A2030 N6-methylase RlmJ
MDPKEMEEELVQKLTEGEMEKENADEAARKRLPIKTEIRIQAQIDPVVEETKQFRQMAEEVDDRYKRYDRLVNESEDSNMRIDD